MGKNLHELSRRNFLELVAVGAAGAAISGLAAPSAFSAASKTAPAKAGIPKRGGTLKAGVGWLIQTPDPHRRAGGWARFGGTQPNAPS